MSALIPLLVSLRPWQWVKNWAVFIPFVFGVNSAWGADDLSLALVLLGKSLIVFGLFCATSGAVYLLNDIVDRREDRAHPVKSRRPIASGALSGPVALVWAGALAAVGLVGSLALDLGLTLIVVVYLTFNVGYSLRGKRVVLLDVMLVASGYVLRMAAGAVFLDIATSPWLYMTLGLGALFIVLGKRQSEALLAGEGAPLQRPVLDQYSPDLLRLLLAVTTTGTLLAYGFYLFTAETLPADQSMFLTFPIVVFGLFRYLYLVEVKREGESPELMILKDAPLVLAILAWAALSVVVLVIGR